MLNYELLDPGLLFYMNMRNALKSFDCNTMQVQVYNVPQLTCLYQGFDSVQFLTLDKNTLFICGGANDYGAVMNDCYTCNISTNT